LEGGGGGRGMVVKAGGRPVQGRTKHKREKKKGHTRKGGGIVRDCGRDDQKGPPKVWGGKKS